MGPERKLYQKVKKNITSISWIRLENLSLSGTPDLLGYNDSGTFFTIELKTTKANKIKFLPHQIAFHKRHPKNTFILVQHLGSGCVKLYEGSRILELEACGLKLDACCSGLEACGLLLNKLGAWCLRLAASSISQCGTVSSIACCLGPGPVARLLGAVALVGLMAWSVSLASLPEMGLTWSSLLRASFRKFL